MNIEDKELIQTLRFSPSLPLVALRYWPVACNSEQKRFISLLLLKKALTQIKLKILIEAEFLNHR